MSSRKKASAKVSPPISPPIVQPTIETTVNDNSQKVDVAAAPVNVEPLSLEDQVLAYIATQPRGVVDVTAAAAATGLSELQIRQTWDQLYSKAKVTVYFPYAPAYDQLCTNCGAALPAGVAECYRCRAPVTVT